MVIVYRRFGTNYCSHLEGQEVQEERILRVKKSKKNVFFFDFLYRRFGTTHCSQLKGQEVQEKRFLLDFLTLDPSAAKLIRSALFWDITQCRVVILCRRFGTTYRPHIQGSRSPKRKKKSSSFKKSKKKNLFFLDFLTLEDGTDTLSRNVGKGLPHDVV